MQLVTIPSLRPSAGCREAETRLLFFPHQVLLLFALIGKSSFARKLESALVVNRYEFYRYQVAYFADILDIFDETVA